MTKLKARTRAKAKAAEKAQKRAAAPAEGDASKPTKAFDNPGHTIKGPRVNPGAMNFGGSKRGAARSK